MNLYLEAVLKYSNTRIYQVQTSNLYLSVSRQTGSQVKLGPLPIRFKDVQLLWPGAGDFFLTVARLCSRLLTR